ncbi:TIM-barrel domain-containing protein [Waltera sp.]|jgi:alpha-D-xyloside xylohydrolase|uniref:glycoside hydrolase family 31 protein n=1 Tax=Waltera sp. TaxID=2815806 RepID=UPI003AB74249
MVNNKTITFNTQDGTYRLMGIRENIFRCVYSQRKIDAKYSPLGIHTDALVELEVKETQELCTISSSKLVLQIIKEDGRFIWKEKETDKLLLQEEPKELTQQPFIKHKIDGERPIIHRVKTVDGERNFIENLKPVEDHMAYRGKLAFRFQDEEQIHGLGQGEEGIYDYRGHVQYLYQHNMRIPIPFFLSTRGYGILIDNGSLMTWGDDERGSYIYIDSCEQLDYYVITGDRLDKIIDGYRELTGKAVMLPKWAFGYIQSKEVYHDQDEFLETARRYREKNIPIDCLVQDWDTWEADCWGNKIVDKSRYPDLAAMNRELHEMNIHTMISIWPNMNAGTKNYNQMSEKGFLLKDDTTYDAFSEPARACYWEQIEEELFSGGYDAWWCDSTEPFSGPDWNGAHMREPWERFLLVGNEHKKFLNPDRANLYAVAHARGIYENQRRSAPDKRVVNLTRSGYAKSQAYGTILWSGDITATWDTLKKQITEGLNMCMSGMPYWTLDIGGFFTVHRKWQNRGCFCSDDPTPKWFWKGGYEDGVADCRYRELYVRWFQYGVFLPVFRSHGTDTPREVWQFGNPGDMCYDALVAAIQLRYRLLPYIYTWAAKVYFENQTMMRSLLFDYQQDSRAAALDSQFMFGTSILVCPVTEPMYLDQAGNMDDEVKTTACYLPAGDRWYDFYTSDCYEGGQEIAVTCPLQRIPLFVKAGSILPMENGLMYARQEVETPFEIHIYSGKDAEFTLYEDDGEGYGYEQGRYNQILMKWEEKTKEFVIHESDHDFLQSIRGRRCVLWVDNRRDQEFTYTGKRICVKQRTRLWEGEGIL